MIRFVNPLSYIPENYRQRAVKATQDGYKYLINGARYFGNIFWLAATSASITLLPMRRAIEVDVGPLGQGLAFGQDGNHDDEIVLEIGGDCTLPSEERRDCVEDQW